MVKPVADSVVASTVPGERLPEATGRWIFEGIVHEAEH